MLRRLNVSVPSIARESRYERRDGLSRSRGTEAYRRNAYETPRIRARPDAIAHRGDTAAGLFCRDLGDEERILYVRVCICVYVRCVPEARGARALSLARGSRE